MEGPGEEGMGAMAQDFMRAHGDKQKAQRVDQIVEAALALYDEVGYDKITFSKLAKGLGFTRINLYNYFKTKEDLFLEIVRRSYEELVDDLLETLPHERKDRRSFFCSWVEVIARHPRTIELFVLMNMQVLRNVGKDRQEEFQEYLDSMVKKAAGRAALSLDIDEADVAWRLVAHLLNYAMGLYPIIIRRYGYTDEAEEAFKEGYGAFTDALDPQVG